MALSVKTKLMLLAALAIIGIAALAITSQIENGIFVRMAAFAWTFGDDAASTPAKHAKKA